MTSTDADALTALRSLHAATLEAHYLATDPAWLPTGQDAFWARVHQDRLNAPGLTAGERLASLGWLDRTRWDGPPAREPAQAPARGFAVAVFDDEG